MAGDTLAAVKFPATDRPSARFVSRCERALRSVPDDVLGPPLSMALNGCVEAAFGDCLAAVGPTSRHVVVSMGGIHGLIGIPDAVRHALIEFAYGGDGSEPAAAPLAPTRLAARFGDRIATMLAAAIAPALSGVEIVVIGVTDMPAETVPMKALALACAFEVMAREMSLGTISIYVPVRALAVIESDAGGSTIDGSWSVRIENAVGAARIKLRCVLDVRAIIRLRRMRDRFFRSDLFADPAWDMLLDLLAARLEQIQVAVSSLCIAAAVPPTTALRWIKTMSENGMFVRVADPHDGRRVFIALSDGAAAGMTAYLNAAKAQGGLAV